MQRKRRSNRCAQPSRLDHYVVLFAYGQSSKPLSERLFRSVTLRIAQRMVDDGEAESFVERTDNGPVTFYRETKANAGATYISPATLTLSTMDAIARHAMGDRLSRRQRDEVEKVAVWPLIGDTKAVAVRPRISDSDRRHAEQLLGEKRGGRTDGSTRCYRSRRNDTRVLHVDAQPLAVAA